jgi:hypothetical protein
VRLEGLGQLKKIHLIGTRTHDLPACSTLLRALPKGMHGKCFLILIDLAELGVEEVRCSHFVVCSRLPCRYGNPDVGWSEDGFITFQGNYGNNPLGRYCVSPALNKEHKTTKG